jgi:hypothetical protein
MRYDRRPPQHARPGRLQETRPPRSRRLWLETLESRRLLSGTDPSHALYVWRDPGRDGTPVDQQEAVRIAEFARSEDIRQIFYDGYGDHSCGTAAGIQFQTATAPACTGTGDGLMGSIIETFHQAGLEVEALYTDATRIPDVVAYNGRVATGRRFDGIRLNHEVEPTTAADIQYYRNAVTAAGAIPLYADISHHWDNLILFNGSTKPAYQHIIDVTKGVDIQTVQDQAAVIVAVSADEVAYASSLGKPVHVTIETYDVVTHLGMQPFNTFFEEGAAKMKSELAGVTYPGVAHPNFAYHFYRQSLGSAVLPGWVWSVSSGAYNLLTERATADQESFFVYQDADSGFNHGFPSGWFPASAQDHLQIDSAAINDPTSPSG